MILSNHALPPSAGDTTNGSHTAAFPSASGWRDRVTRSLEAGRSGSFLPLPEPGQSDTAGKAHRATIRRAKNHIPNQAGALTWRSDRPLHSPQQEFQGKETENLLALHRFSKATKGSVNKIVTYVQQPLLVRLNWPTLAFGPVAAARPGIPGCPCSTAPRSGRARTYWGRPRLLTIDRFALSLAPCPHGSQVAPGISGRCGSRCGCAGRRP